MHRVLAVVILLSVAVAVLDTVQSVRAEWRAGCVGGVRLRRPVHARVRRPDLVRGRGPGRPLQAPGPGPAPLRPDPARARRPPAILPFYLALLIPVDLVLLRTLRLLRILKITRYSPAMATIELVIVNERRSL